MNKASFVAAALAFGALISTAGQARADGWTSKVARLSERPTAAGGAVAHGFAVVFENGKVALAPTTSAAVTDRFVTMIIAAFLSGKNVYIDTGSCVPTATTDCPALGYEIFN